MWRYTILFFKHGISLCIVFVLFDRIFVWCGMQSKFERFSTGLEGCQLRMQGFGSLSYGVTGRFFFGGVLCVDSVVIMVHVDCH